MNGKLPFLFVWRSKRFLDRSDSAMRERLRVIVISPAFSLPSIVFLVVLLRVVGANMMCTTNTMERVFPFFRSLEMS